jgi:fibronectin-binding autotransporter adhesin
MKSRFGFFAALLLCPLCIRAQTTVSWDSLTSANWTSGGAWLGGIVPGNGDIVTFQGLASGTSTVNESLSLGGMQFSILQIGPMTLNATGGNTITIQSGGVIAYGALFDVNLNVPILGAGNLWLNGGTGTVTLNPGTGSNTYTGSTEVFGGGTLADGEANSFSAGSVLFPGGTGGGTVLVNFDETIAGLNDGGANGLVKIASGKTLTLTGAFSTTFSGVISDNGGPGSLTVNGPSTTTLEGANTYTGPTVVNFGGGLNIGGGTTTGSIVSDVSGAGGISFDRSNNYTYGGILSGALDVVQQGTGTTTLSGINVYSGITTINFGTLQAGSTSAFGGATGLGNVNVASGATLDLNGFNNTTGALFGAGNVTLGAKTLTLASISNAGVFSGVISGTGGALVMDGDSQDLTNANTYTGGTTITAGTLEADNPSGSATGTGSITIGASGILQIGNGGDANGFVPVGLPINDNGSIRFFRSDAATFPNTITGTGGVGMFGFLSETLTGTNTYSGETESFRGTLIAGSTSAFGGATGLSPVVFDGVGSTVDFGNFSNTVGSISGPAGNFITLGTATLTIGDPASSTTFGGVISGGGNMVFGGNTMILTGANTYTGTTTITNGLVLVANATGSGLGTGPVTIQPGATLEIGASSTAGSVGATTITDNGTINFSRSDVPTDSFVITGTGQIELNAGGVTLTGNNNFSGGTTISTGTILSVGDGLTAGARITGNVFDGDTLVFAPASGDNYTFAGTISGPGNVTFNGPGSITLSGPNSITGPTVVNGGTLSDSAANRFSSASPMQVNSAGGLAVNFNEIVGNLEDSVTGGPVSIASGANLNSIGMNYFADFNGAISGNGSFTISGGVQGLSGNNTYVGGTMLTGVSELFVGSNTAVGTGTLTFNGSATELSPDSNVTLANPIVLNSTMDNDDGGNNSLTLTGPITGGAGITWCTPGTLTLTNAGNTFGGTLDMRAGNLVVANTGATGMGTIVLDSSTSMTVAAVATVSNPLSFTGSAAVLSGNGTISSPAVTIDGGAVLSPTASPGGGPGNLTFTNPLTLASGGAIHFSLFDANGAAGTGYSLITGTTGINLTAATNTLTFNLVSVDINGNAAPSINFNAGSPYTWTFATSPGGITNFAASQFHLITTGFMNGTGGGSFSFTQVGNNLDLNFTPVPEPSTWAMLVGGVFMVVPLALRRRRLAKA